MGDVFVFRLSFLIARSGFSTHMRGGVLKFLELPAALVAEAASNHVLVAAFRAAFLHFPRRHCYKKTLRSFDHFDIPDDKLIVEGQRGVGLEFLILALFQENSDFRDFQFSLSSTPPGCLNMFDR